MSAPFYSISVRFGGGGSGEGKLTGQKEWPLSFFLVPGSLGEQIAQRLHTYPFRGTHCVDWQ